MAVSRVLVGTINFSETQTNTITDLTGTTWYFNETLSYTIGADEFYVNIIFTSNSTNFTSMDYGDEPYGGSSTFTLGYGSNVSAYRHSTGWTNQAYKTITITGGTDATNSDLIAWLQANATQQTAPTSTTQITLGRAFIKKQVAGVVADLTNTTWYLNETVDGTAILSSSFNLSGLTDSDGGETFYDSFSGNVSCEGGGSGINAWYNLTLGSFLWYDGRNLSSLSIDAPYLQYIKITGGTDVTNSTFINWLYANGTLISGAPSGYELVPVSVMRKVAGSGGTVTDLTNTTWEFTNVALFSNVVDPPISEYDITGVIIAPNNAQVSFIGMQRGTDGINFIVTEMSYDLEAGAIDGTNIGFYNDGGTSKVYTNISTMRQTGTFTINVTGGNDVTNSTAITRFQNYLTQVVQNFKPLAIGYISEAPAVSLISFTIAGTTYQAEPNMTWEEWVESEYNTGSFAISYSYALSRNAINKIINEMFVVVCSSPYTAVFVTDIIQSGATYTLEMPAGGAND